MMHINVSPDATTLGLHAALETAEIMREAIAKDGWTPRIICESDGTQPEDALSMKKYYESIFS